MSGIRVSNVWAMEDEYGKGRNTKEWLAPPPGSYISLSYDRSANTIYTPGSKTFDTVAYGAISGSWSWSFNLDYEYMEPLLIAFEGYDVTDNGDGTFTHTLSKVNNKRVPSFVIRRKQLNIMAGGPAQSDEIVEAVGCVCKSIKFNMQAGSSQISVSMSGKFANVHTLTGSLPSTDYKEYNGDLAEFTCMFIGDAKCENYVANVDSLSVGMDNSSGNILNPCTAIAKEYYEGKSDFSFSTSCYSNNPEVFKHRVFSGGYDKTALSPKIKNLKPLPKIVLASYNKSAEDSDISPQTAIDTSTRSVTFTITRCILSSIEWQKGDDAKIMDQLSSVKCGGLEIAIKNSVPDLTKSIINKVESYPDTI